MPSEATMSHVEMAGIKNVIAIMTGLMFMGVGLRQATRVQRVTWGESPCR